MLINLRNALMAGKRLPYDAEVEYLQSTGTQWIDTGYVPTSTSGAQVVGEFISLPTSDYSGFFGCKTTGVSDRFWAVSSNQNNGTLVGFGNNYMMASASLNTIYTTQVNYKNSRTATFTSTTNVSGFNNGGTKPVFLFAVNIGAQAYYQGSMRIYSAQLTESSEIVRDYIPVRVGTVGYLYDRVSGKLFGNAGTGDFVVGQDVVPVEYIESHGTEWIDTGIHLSRTLGAEMVCALNQYDGSPLGINYQNVRFYAPYVYSATQIGYGYGNFITKQATVPLGQVVKSSINFNASQQVSIAGIVDALPTPPSGSYSARTIAAFGFYGYISGVDSARPAKVRMYSINMSDGTSPIRKFRPVRVGTDATSWEGAMMDVLTRRIYRNAGTGAFTYGNDLKYPIPAE